MNIIETTKEEIFSTKNTLNPLIKEILDTFSDQKDRNILYKLIRRAVLDLYKNKAGLDYDKYKQGKYHSGTINGKPESFQTLIEGLVNIKESFSLENIFGTTEETGNFNSNTGALEAHLTNKEESLTYNEKTKQIAKKLK